MLTVQHASSVQWVLLYGAVYFPIVIISTFLGQISGQHLQVFLSRLLTHPSWFASEMLIFTFKSVTLVTWLRESQWSFVGLAILSVVPSLVQPVDGELLQEHWSTQARLLLVEPQLGGLENALVHGLQHRGAVRQQLHKLDVRKLDILVGSCGHIVQEMICFLASLLKRRCDW